MTFPEAMETLREGKRWYLGFFTETLQIHKYSHWNAGQNIVYKRLNRRYIMLLHSNPVCRNL